MVSIARNRRAAAFIAVGALALAAGLSGGSAGQPAAGGPLPPLAAPNAEATESPQGVEGKVRKHISTPTPAVEWVRQRNSADGYELTVPSRFGTPKRTHPGVMAYQLDGRPFTISIGDPSGSLWVCGHSCLESTRCGSLCEPIGRPVKTLDDLEDLLVSVPDPMGVPFRELHSESELGGVPARVEKVARPGDYRLGPTAYYRVFALHDGRPVVLTFDFWSTQNGTISRKEMASIISSFRFLDGTDPGSEPIEPGETPMPETDRMTTFVNRQDGYRLRVPATWRSHPSESEGARPATTFQIPTASGSAARFAMAISVGSADGWITLCTPKCAAVRALSLDELAQYLVPARGSYSRDAVRDIELGGEQGSLEVPKSIALPHYCLPEFVYDAYAIHHDRPVVLRISYCVTRPGGTPEPGLPSDLVTQMLESFEFLD